MKNLFVFILVFTLSTAVYAQQKLSENESISIIYIGNSITEGALHKAPQNTAPPVVTTRMVEKKTHATVYGYNCGFSGATTYDFLPSYKRHFTKVQQAIGKAQVQNACTQFVFSIMLGTNDSACTTTTGAPVSNENYKKNLVTIINALKDIVPNAIFILHRPIWYSPNTYNGAMYLKKGLERVKGYAPILKEIADEQKNVFTGDVDAYDFFAKKHLKYMNAENGFAGTFYLHPTEKGAVKLSKFWSKAIVEVLKNK